MNGEKVVSTLKKHTRKNNHPHKTPRSAQCTAATAVPPDVLMSLLLQLTLWPRKILPMAMAAASLPRSDSKTLLRALARSRPLNPRYTRWISARRVNGVTQRQHRWNKRHVVRSWQVGQDQVRLPTPSYQTMEASMEGIEASVEASREGCVEVVQVRSCQVRSDQVRLGFNFRRRQDNFSCAAQHRCAGILAEVERDSLLGHGWSVRGGGGAAWREAGEYLP